MFFFYCFSFINYFKWVFIPTTGIQLKDLIALHIVLPDKTDEGLLNVQKMIRLASIMSPLLLSQTSQPPVQPNLDLIKMLRVRQNRYSYLTFNALYPQ